jgi:hypothetical protein
MQFALNRSAYSEEIRSLVSRSIPQLAFRKWALPSAVLRRNFQYLFARVEAVGFACDGRFSYLALKPEKTRALNAARV